MEIDQSVVLPDFDAVEIATMREHICELQRSHGMLRGELARERAARASLEDRLGRAARGRNPAQRAAAPLQVPAIEHCHRNGVVVTPDSSSKADHFLICTTAGEDLDVDAVYDDAMSASWTALDSLSPALAAPLSNGQVAALELIQGDACRVNMQAASDLPRARSTPPMAAHREQRCALGSSRALLIEPDALSARLEVRRASPAPLSPSDALATPTSLAPPDAFSAVALSPTFRAGIPCNALAANLMLPTLPDALPAPASSSMALMLPDLQRGPPTLVTTPSVGNACDTPISGVTLLTSPPPGAASHMPTSSPALVMLAASGDARLSPEPSPAFLAPAALGCGHHTPRPSPTPFATAACVAPHSLPPPPGTVAGGRADLAPIVARVTIEVSHDLLQVEERWRQMQDEATNLKGILRDLGVKRRQGIVL
eukprot:NODE_8597_length_1483_cov_5.233038.p1 GENE.NODE_8597_length_1483_cov_5.233038~~NODE_8597_length_1483_cov_5.233038.p1  ORF type:complete len:428 (-),score=68.11 NODE_8597_length_1483_cov_5.233038:108-1391(-)